jgi:hypothetical protein
VVSVRTRVGANVTSASPVMILSKPGPPIVQADLTDTDTSQLSVGQTATVQLDSGDAATGAALSANLTALNVDSSSRAGTDSAASAPTAFFSVDWPQAGVKFGTPVQVNVTLQQKPAVLVVPIKAVHKAGPRTYVEVMEGSMRRVVNVQVGIKGLDTVEIVSGLTEGQMVLVPSS